MNPLDKLPVRKIKAKAIGGKWVNVLVDGDYDGEWFATLKLRILPHGQIQVTDRSITQESGNWVYLHHLVLPQKPGYWVEHINGNKADNRSANLRYATPKEIMKKRVYLNGHGPSNNMTGSPNKHGFRGVVKQGGRNTWSARCMSKHLGSFRSKEEAAKAYDKRAFELWGDRAALNFPDERSLEVKVTDKEFERIKDMQKLGVKASAAQRIFHRPHVTINRIFRSESLEEYHKGIKEERDRYPKSNKATVAEPASQEGLLATVLEVKKNIDKLVIALADVQQEIKRIPKRRQF